MNAETEQKVTLDRYISPMKLHPHPLQIRVYGVEAPDAALIESIRNNGVQEPLVVVETTHDEKSGLFILSGHRRAGAATILGIDVPIRVLDDQGEEWQRTYLLEANRHRVKNILQLSREYIEIKKIELLHPSADGGTASERAAERVGLREDIARKMEVIIQKANDGDQIAIEGLKKILSRERSVVSIFRAVSLGELPENNDHYNDVAEALEEALDGFFRVSHSSNSEHVHGYLFKRRFANRTVAEAFVKMMQSIPASEQQAFAAVLNKKQ